MISHKLSSFNVNCLRSILKSNTISNVNVLKSWQTLLFLMLKLKYFFVFYKFYLYNLSILYKFFHILCVWYFNNHQLISICMKYFFFTLFFSKQDFVFFLIILFNLSFFVDMLFYVYIDIFYTFFNVSKLQMFCFWPNAYTL